MSKELSIAVLGPTQPFRGGISHHTSLLVQALRRRHHVRFFSYIRQYPRWLYPGGDDREPGAANTRDADVFYTLDSLNPWTWLKTARRICSHDPDLLLIPWWTVYWAPQLAYINAYVHCHSRARIIFLCHNTHDHESNRAKALLSNVVLKAGSAILCHSDEECEDMRRHFPGKIIRKIYHPTYSSLVKSQPGEERIRAAHPKLLFFGFIRPYKGLDVLLRAMPEIHRRTGAVLRIAGELWDNRSGILGQIKGLENAGMASGDLRYVPIEEMPSIFEDAHLVILPYRSATGCGIVQLAFGSGKPVVASDVGGLHDAVSEGVNGLLVAPDDEHALAEAVVRALGPSVYPQLASGARTASKQFSWDGLVDILEQVAGQLSVWRESSLRRDQGPLNSRTAGGGIPGA